MAALAIGLDSCAYPVQLGQDARVAEPREIQLQVGALQRRSDVGKTRAAPLAPWLGARVGVAQGVDVGLRLYPMLDEWDQALSPGAYADVKVALWDGETLRIAIAPGLGVYPSNPYVDADAVTGEEPSRLGTTAVAVPLIIDWNLVDWLALSTSPTVHAAVMDATTDSGESDTHHGAGIGAHVAVAIDLGDMIRLYPECSVLHGIAGDSSTSPDYERVLHRGTTLVEFGLSVALTGLNTE